MAEPEVFDWDEWENGKAYELTNDELVGALLSEAERTPRRVKTLEDRQSRADHVSGHPAPRLRSAGRSWASTSRRWVAASPQARERAHVCFKKKWRSHSHV